MILPHIAINFISPMMMVYLKRSIHNISYPECSYHTTRKKRFPSGMIGTGVQLINTI